MTSTSDIPQLISELCRQFYGLGWVSGTGGGISIRADAGIYMAPSGVQKERIAPGDVYLLDGDDLEQCRVLVAPKISGSKVSECQPLFYNAFRKREAGAVIHSHSVWAMLAARLASPRGEPGIFACEGLEMQKGLRGKGCFERIEVPIIANTARESELTESMAAAMDAHPDVDAVLVAGHGVYVWGRDWVQAKTQAECYDYLFRASIEAHRMGMPLVDDQTPARRSVSGPTLASAQGTSR